MRSIVAILLFSLSLIFCLLLKYSVIYALNEKLNSMMKGGGILSMLNVGLIVAISSSYSGIFKETKM